MNTSERDIRKRIAKQAALEAMARRLLRLILDGCDPDVIRESAVEIVEEIDRE